MMPMKQSPVMFFLKVRDHPVIAGGGFWRASMADSGRPREFAALVQQHGFYAFVLAASLIFGNFLCLMAVAGSVYLAAALLAPASAGAAPAAQTSSRPADAAARDFLLARDAFERRDAKALAVATEKFMPGSGIHF